MLHQLKRRSKALLRTPLFLYKKESLLFSTLDADPLAEPRCKAKLPAMLMNLQHTEQNEAQNMDVLL